MNKGKVFVITIISILTISFISVVGLSIYIISTSNFSLNNIVSYTPVQVSQVEEITSETFLVIDIVDGDTVKVIENGERKTIRLIGIDAPEVKSKDCKSEESTQLLSNLILNREVTLESDSTQTDLDRYGRELRYVFLDGININQEIIEEGLALEYTYSKAYKYKDEFLQAENNAKVQEIGIWSSDCLYQQ